MNKKLLNYWSKTMSTNIVVSKQKFLENNFTQNTRKTKTRPKITGRLYYSKKTELNSFWFYF